MSVFCFAPPICIFQMLELSAFFADETLADCATLGAVPAAAPVLFFAYPIRFLLDPKSVFLTSLGS